MKISENISIGIDIGGTSIDIALVSLCSSEVILVSKSETVYENEIFGLVAAFGKIKDRLDAYLNSITSIKISSTLATNALATGSSLPVGLILIGHEEEYSKICSIRRNVKCAETLYVRGGHTRLGEEACELDSLKIMEGAKDWHGKCDGIAVASMFSHRNQNHELAAKKIVSGILNVPIVCSSQISHVNGLMKRAHTAVLNAGLIPIMDDMIKGCRRFFDSLGLYCPLYFVRGDGTLMSMERARESPVETVYSGPAASIRGFSFVGRRGGYFSDDETVYVYDIGGTTTDIGIIEQGEPESSVSDIGVEFLNTHTVAVGGNSIVCVCADKITIGPQSVTPLSKGSVMNPGVLKLLEDAEVANYCTCSMDVRIVVIKEKNFCYRNDDALPEELFIFNLFEDKPHLWDEFLNKLTSDKSKKTFMSMIAQKKIEVMAFTPTDALVVLGRMTAEGKVAACLAAGFLSKDRSPVEFAEMVVAAVNNELSSAAVYKIMIDEGFDPSDASGRKIAENLLYAGQQKNLILKISTRIGKMGSPSQAFEPSIGVFPGIIEVPGYETLNAVGAATTPLKFRYTVDVEKLPSGGYRAFAPWGEVDCRSPEECAAMVEEQAFEWVNDCSLCGEPGEEFRKCQIKCCDISCAGTEVYSRFGLCKKLRLEFSQTS